MSSYLKEHFMHSQTENVCKFAGYTIYLKHLLPENKQASLSLFLFDGNVQKVVEELLNKSCT
jgi:hypothetical protein